MGDVRPRLHVSSLRRGHPAVPHWLGDSERLSSQEVWHCLCRHRLFCSYMSLAVFADGYLLRLVLLALLGMPKPLPFCSSRSLRGVAGGWRRVRLTADRPAEGTGVLVARHGAVTLERFWFGALGIVAGLRTLIFLESRPKAGYATEGCILVIQALGSLSLPMKAQTM